jgi:hypothetical protein
VAKETSATPSNFEASDYQVNTVLAMIFLLHAYFSLLSYLFCLIPAEQDLNKA